MISFDFENGDWTFQANGRALQVSGRPRLIQALNKALNTEKQNDINRGDIMFRYNPSYGSDLKFLYALNQIVSFEDILNTVRTTVSDSIIQYASIQRNKIPLGLDPSEVLVDSDVSTFIERENNPNGPDQIVVKYEIRVQTQDGSNSNLLSAGLQV